MRFENLQQQATFLVQSITSHEREYALSERAVLSVEFFLVPRPPQLIRLAPVHGVATDSGKALSIVIRAVDASHGMPLPVECMNAKDIAKVAEIRAMIDDWIAGKTDELPPSTSTKIAELRERMGSQGFPGYFPPAG